VKGTQTATCQDRASNTSVISRARASLYPRSPHLQFSSRRSLHETKSQPTIVSRYKLPQRQFPSRNVDAAVHSDIDVEDYWESHNPIAPHVTIVHRWLLTKCDIVSLRSTRVISVHAVVRRHLNAVQESEPRWALIEEQETLLLMDNCQSHIIDDTMDLLTAASVRVVSFAPHTRQSFSCSI
jgi:hypothetical protein